MNCTGLPHSRPLVHNEPMLPRRLYLTCHGLGTPPAGTPDDARQFWLPAAQFQRCLDVAAELEGSTDVDIRFCFDDGNASDHSIALPGLLACGRTAIFFVCAGRIGQPDYLGAGQLREMVEAGMTIGCHGYDHINWNCASDAELRRELVDGRRVIEDVIGRPVALASSPYGGISRRVVRFAAEAGYTCLFSSSGGFATGRTGLIPRTSLRTGFDAARDLPRMVKRSGRAWDGCYDTIRRLKFGFR